MSPWGTTSRSCLASCFLYHYPGKWSQESSKELPEYFTFRWEPTTESTFECLHTQAKKSNKCQQSPWGSRTEATQAPNHWRETNPRNIVAMIHPGTEIIQRVSWTQGTQNSSTASFEDALKWAFLVLWVSLKAEFGLLLSPLCSLFFFWKFSNFDLNFKELLKIIHIF